MRVLLISPMTKESAIPLSGRTPLNVTYIASLLRQARHAVSIFDRHAILARVGLDKNAVNKAMLDHLQAFKPDVVGFSTKSPLIYDTLECASRIREHFSGVMVAGGLHATALPEETLRKIPELDVVVEGEGEFPMLRLADGDALETIPGIWTLDSGQNVRHTPRQQIESLDELPFPALDLLDMAYYTRPSTSVVRGHYVSSVSLQTSRGCTQHCDFCTSRLAYGSGVRFHSVEYVLEWMRQLLQDYHIEALYFMDQDFLIDEERAEGFCDKMLSSLLHKRAKWCILTRPDRIRKKILNTLKRAGCFAILLGVESPLQAQLNSVHKGMTCDDNENAIRLIKGAGMSVHANMMIGFEGETLSDLGIKLEWTRRVRPTSFFWVPIQLFPGSMLYKTRGDRFFETHSWNEENVVEYFNGFPLASYTRQEYEEWRKKYFDGYSKRARVTNLFLKNSPLKAIDYLIKTRSERKALLKG